MDDLTFSARRATAAASVKTAEPPDLDTRFRTLVQSPLRAGILRYLNSRPEEGFDVEALMQTFGRLRLDVENCVRELVDFGVARITGSTPPQYVAERPGNVGLAEQLDLFLERRAAVSTEDQSPSVQRFREMIGRDEKMLIVFEWIRTAAKSDISVLILGPWLLSGYYIIEGYVLYGVLLFVLGLIFLLWLWKPWQPRKHKRHA